MKVGFDPHDLWIGVRWATTRRLDTIEEVKIPGPAGHRPNDPYATVHEIVKHESVVATIRACIVPAFPIQFQIRRRLSEVISRNGGAHMVDLGDNVSPEEFDITQFGSDHWAARMSRRRPDDS